MSKETAALRVLQDMGFIKDEELSPEEEQLLKQALDPEEQYFADILDVFSGNMINK